MSQGNFSKAMAPQPSMHIYAQLIRSKSRFIRLSWLWPQGLWRKLTVLFLLFCVGLTTGCSLDQFAKAESTPSRLVSSVLSEPKTFNPVLNEEYPNIFLYAFRGLTQEDGVTGEVVPSLAESWDISEDGKTIVFTLREGLKWSDGEPLTSEDVTFTFNEVIFNEEVPTSSRDVMRIGEQGLLPKVRALDERRVEFQLPEPFAPFLRTMAIEIIPAHILRPTIEAKDADGNLRFLSTWGSDTDPTEIISNGPYRLQQYVNGERIIFERNPYYWETDQQGNQQPYIEEVIWTINPSSETSLLQFRSGDLDVIGISPTYFSLLKTEAQRGNFTIYNGGQALGTSYIALNQNRASRNGKPLVNPIKSRWFNSVAFRQAISYGIDREKLIYNTYQGLGQPQTSPISVQSPYYVPPEEGIPDYPYNPEKARQLLLDDGFQFNAAGELLDWDGNRVRFTLNAPSGSKTHEANGAQIKQDLEKLGIQIDFQPLAFNLIVDKITDSLDWEAIMLGLTGGLEPNGGANVWALDGSLHMFNQDAQPGQAPLDGWQAADWEKEIADLYIQGARTIDEAERKEIYKRTQLLTQTYLPFIYLVNPLNLGAVRNTVGNVKYSGVVQPSSTWNIQELTIEP
jgi:peptide/nickel transport system substrate-binding protein